MSKHRDHKELSARHEQFAQLLAAGKNYVEAYRECGFGKGRMQSDTCNASRLRSQLRWRIDEIKGVVPTETPVHQIPGMTDAITEIIEMFRADMKKAHEILWEIIDNKKTADGV